MRCMRTLLISGLVVAAPLSVWADEGAKAPKNIAPKIDDSLLETQKRLEALINAAVEHDLVSVKGDKPKKTKGANGKFLSEVGDSVKGYENCTNSEIFTIPVESHVTNYNALVAIRNSIITGPNELDKSKIRQLVLAYIGLGFGEEALVYAEYLQGQDRNVLMAMARTVDDLANAKDAMVLQAESDCFKGEVDAALLWSRLASLHAGSDGVHEELTTDQLKVIKKFPPSLSAIMAERLGMSAVKHGDLIEAKSLLKVLKTGHKKKKLTGPLGDEASLFQAMYKHAKQDASAVPILERLAQKESAVQARASKMLNDVQSGSGGASYEGYELDLEAITLVYDGRPEAKQALAQKIEFYAKQGKIREAIDFFKDGISPNDVQFQAGLKIFSEHLLSALQGENEQDKLNALNVLVRELSLFEQLPDSFPLKQVGVKASLDLELLEIVTHLLKKSEWAKLDKQLAKDLALVLPSSMKSMLPPHAFKGDKYELEEIKAAFQEKRPSKALRIQGKLPGNADALQVVADQAWQGGYWGVARNAIAKLDEENKDTSIKSALAETLSVSSPLLNKSARKRGILELNALQTFLDNDLAVIRGYVSGG